MWRVWNSVAKGFRSTAARSCRENIGPDADQSNIFPLRQSLRSIQSETSTKNEAQSTSESFPTRPLKEYTLAEAVGLGTALALGCQLCHNGRRNQTSSLDCTPSLFDTVTKIAFAQPEHNSTKLQIVKETKPRSDVQLNAETINQHVKPNTAEECPSETGPQSSTKSLIPEMMDSAVKDLLCGEDLVMGDLQNQAGVQLLLAAQQGGNTGDRELDELLGLGKSTACQREAFACFREASKLGSTKAKFNLGLCYEQGIGARESLSKAVRYYEEAAKEGHAAAQYNLGLLYYTGRIPGQPANREQAIQLWRQSARQGVGEAWTALLTVLNAGPLSQLEEGSTTSLSLLEDVSVGLQVKSSPSFRKSRSEPHDLCTLNSTPSGNLIVI